METVPTLFGYTELHEIGFYDYLNLKECIFKGMNKNVSYKGVLPSDLPTKKMIVGKFFHKGMELLYIARNKQALLEDLESEIKKIQDVTNKYPYLKKEGAVDGWNEINRAAVKIISLYEVYQNGRSLGEIKPERLLRSKDGLIIGRPDLIIYKKDTAIIKEYKTAILRNESNEIKEEYLSQLKFYALLLSEIRNYKSLEVQLENIQGEFYSTELQSSEISEFRQLLVDFILEVNKKILNSNDISELSSPSPTICISCNKRLVCTSFIRSQDKFNNLGNKYVLDGTVESINHAKSGYYATIVVKDSYLNKSRSIDIPLVETEKISIGKRFVFLDISNNMGSTSWTGMSRIFAYD